MIDDVVHLIRFELVEDGHDDGTIGHGGEVGYCPMDTVASADSDTIAWQDACLLEENVEFLNFACNVFVLASLPLEVGQGVPVPVFLDGLLNESDKVLVLILDHCVGIMGIKG